MSLCWVETFDNFHDAFEFGTAIVWAPDEASAIVAMQKWHGWSLEESPYGARRMPEWDKFAGNGVIPIAELLSAGWSMECAHCQKMLSDDMEMDEDEEGNPVEPPEPVGDSHIAFCGAQCQADWDEERRVRREMKAKATAIFHRAMGDEVELTSVSTVQNDGRMWLEFRLPGAIASMRYKFHPETCHGSFWVNPNDIGVFRRHARQRRLDRGSDYAEGDFANCVG